MSCSARAVRPQAQPDGPAQHIDHSYTGVRPVRRRRSCSHQRSLKTYRQALVAQAPSHGTAKSYRQRSGHPPCIRTNGSVVTGVVHDGDGGPATVRIRHWEMAFTVEF